MTEKELWGALREQGFNEYAAAGIMGNMRAESGLHPDRVQGDIPYSDWSKEYTQMVDSGRISREDFMLRGPGGGGYGLCQWTFWSRKKMLYDFAKEAGTSIGDGKMQAAFFACETKTSYKAAVYEPLMAAKSVREASDVMLLNYERPADQSRAAREKRAGYGMEYYKKYAKGEGETEMAENNPMLQSGSRGEAVKKCQALLMEKGYALPKYGADGDYGGETLSAVKRFQRDSGLTADGICGPATWAALLREEEKQETSTGNAAVDKLLKIALGEVGYLEKASNKELDSKTGNAGYSNWTKYARDIDRDYPNFYNGKKNGYAWCDVFVDWCFLKAFGYETALKLLCAPERSSGAGCSFSAGYFRKAGRFFAAPEPGDQIFFGIPGGEYHTGLVYKVDGSRVYTVEGNTDGGAGVTANGGGVFQKSYALGSGEISGYGRPDWGLVGAAGEEKPEEKPAAPEKPAEPEAENIVKLETLRKGGKGGLVKAAQLLLIGRGFSCGAAGADGDFGQGTENAVKKFQQLYDLEDDGEVGGETWGRLLRG